MNAATEGLRRIRDRALALEAKQKQPKKHAAEPKTELEKRIAAEYAHHSAQVLQALGMSVTQFNNLG